MSGITIKLLYGMMIMILTNILTHSGKYEKQIRFLSGIIFSSMIIGIVSDICNIYASEISVFSIPEIVAREDGYGIYEDMSGYILSDYTQQLQRDMTQRINDELDTDCEISVSVNEDIGSDEYGMITSVEIADIGDDEFISAKKILKSFYDADETHIFIHRKEE